MPRDGNRRQSQMRARIAAAAARLMAEDGIDDFALAKRKAARQLGAADTQSLPANDEIEAELRAYQSLYQGEEQRERIHELRTVALEAMRSLADFRPYLAGPVLKGTAGRYADIDLQLFTDDLKAVELFLLNRNFVYAVSEQRHYCGDEPRRGAGVAPRLGRRTGEPRRLRREGRTRRAEGECRRPPDRAGKPRRGVRPARRGCHRCIAAARSRRSPLSPHSPWRPGCTSASNSERGRLIRLLCQHSLALISPTLLGAAPRSSAGAGR